MDDPFPHVFSLLASGYSRRPSCAADIIPFLRFTHQSPAIPGQRAALTANLFATYLLRYLRGTGHPNTDGQAPDPFIIGDEDSLKRDRHNHALRAELLLLAMYDSPMRPMDDEWSLCIRFISGYSDDNQLLVGALTSASFGHQT